MKHDLYTTADKDRPSQICDGNGEVVLGLCKVCGQAEGDLQAECPGAPDKTCTIAIHNVLGWELDSAMTAKALAVAARWVSGSKTIDIYPQQRVPEDAPAWKNPGWLEWVVRCHGRSGTHGSVFEIHIIQRKPGADFECHS